MLSCCAMNSKMAAPESCDQLATFGAKYHSVVLPMGNLTKKRFDCRIEMDLEQQADQITSREALIKQDLNNILNMQQRIAHLDWIKSAKSNPRLASLIEGLQQAGGYHIKMVLSEIHPWHGQHTTFVMSLLFRIFMTPQLNSVKASPEE